MKFFIIFVSICVVVNCHQSFTDEEQLQQAESKNNSCNVNFYLTNNDTHPIWTTSSSLPVIAADVIINQNHLKRSSFLYNMVSMTDEEEKEDNVNDSCLKEMKEIKRGIDERKMWAMKVLDSSGSPDSGFILSNDYWLGSRIGCETANLKITIADRVPRAMKHGLVNVVPPFEVEYRMIYSKHNSPWQYEAKVLGEGILHMGVCIPKSCTNGEIQNMSQKIFDSKNLHFQSLYEMNPKVIRVKDLKLRDEFYSHVAVKIFGYICLVTILLTVAGLLSDRLDPDQGNNNDTQTPISLVERILKCYSIKDNFKWLLKTDTTPASIPVINGIRSIACFWILAFHTFWFSQFAMDNKAISYSYSEQLVFQGIANAPLLVDVFFSISGFLLAHNFFKNKRQMEEIKNNSFMKNVIMFGKLVLQRYIRFTALHVMVMLTTAMVDTYLEDTSLFYIHERNDLLLQDFGWRNLLYIQNLFYHKEICMNWTWSLACEMQFYIVFLAILFLYSKNHDSGKKVFLVFSGTILVLSFYIGITQKFNFLFDTLYETGSWMYTPPYTRVHPFYVGIIGAYFLKKTQGSLCLNKSQLRNIWIVVTFLAILAFNATIVREMRPLFATFLIFFERFCIGYLSSWVIIASQTGYGNWFTRFLAWPVFAHLNKLSFAIYLLNPMVVTFLTGIRSSPMHVDVSTFPFIVEMGCMCYLLAIVYALFFEIPYNRLTDEFLKNRRPSPNNQAKKIS